MQYRSPNCQVSPMISESRVKGMQSEAEKNNKHFKVNSYTLKKQCHYSF
jgi:hypothetical protein